MGVLIILRRAVADVNAFIMNTAGSLFSSAAGVNGYIPQSQLASAAAAYGQLMCDPVASLSYGTYAYHSQYPNPQNSSNASIQQQQPYFNHHGSSIFAAADPAVFTTQPNLCSTSTALLQAAAIASNHTQGLSAAVPPHYEQHHMFSAYRSPYQQQQYYHYPQPAGNSNPNSRATYNGLDGAAYSHLQTNATSAAQSTTAPGLPSVSLDQMSAVPTLPLSMNNTNNNFYAASSQMLNHGSNLRTYSTTPPSSEKQAVAPATVPYSTVQATQNDCGRPLLPTAPYSAGNCGVFPGAAASLNGSFDTLLQPSPQHTRSGGLLTASELNVGAVNLAAEYQQQQHQHERSRFLDERYVRAAQILRATPPTNGETAAVQPRNDAPRQLGPPSPVENRTTLPLPVQHSAQLNNASIEPISDLNAAFHAAKEENLMQGENSRFAKQLPPSPIQQPGVYAWMRRDGGHTRRTSNAASGADPASQSSGGNKRKLHDSSYTLSNGKYVDKTKRKNSVRQSSLLYTTPKNLRSERDTVKRLKPMCMKHCRRKIFTHHRSFFEQLSPRTH